MDAITTAFVSAVTSMATNVTDMVAAALPAVAPIAGVGIAISAAWSIVRRFTR